MGFVGVSVGFVLGFMWSRFGVSGCLVWGFFELLFRQGLFWGLLRVGLGFIQGRFRVYLGLV